MTTFDPFELLAALNPLPELTETLPTDDAMLRSIAAGEVSPRRSVRRGRHLRIGGAAAVVLVLAAVAAFAFSDRQRSTVALDGVMCYSEVAVTPHVRAVVPIDGDPIQACRDAWARGEFVDAGATEAPSTLGTCVAPTGVLVVVPGGIESCDELGYPVWSGTTANPAFEELAAQVNVWLYPQAIGKCVSYTTALAVAQGAFHEFDLTGWTIEEMDRWAPNWDHRICTKVTADGARRALIVSFAIYYPKVGT